MANIIQMRGDTAAQWTAVNPVLHAREIGIETDTFFQYKIGDGTSDWVSLPYGGLTGAVGPEGPEGPAGPQGPKGEDSTVPGPPGPSTPSADSGNDITVGSDNLLYLNVVSGGGGDFMADGSVPMTGDFQGGGNKLTGIADGTDPTDAATIGQLPVGGGDFKADGSVPMTGDFQGGGNKLTGIAEGTEPTDAATVSQLGGGGGGGDFMADGSVPMTGDFQGGGNLLTGIADGIADDDAATIGQLATKLDVTATAADSSKLGGQDPAYYATADHLHDDRYFQESEFIDVSAGAGDAGKPILLDSTGQIDPSMLDVSVFYYVDEFTPASGAEYPDTTGHTHGAFWVVQALTGDYTFTGGDLSGRIISNGDFMVWSAAGWSIMASEMNPTLYYKLDGTQALTAPFAGGGQVISNIADGVADTDAATVGQLGGGGDFMADGSVPMTGDFQGGGHLLTDIANGIASDDAATMNQLINHPDGDFKSTGSVPMTGNMTFNAPSSEEIFTRILRDDSTLKLVYGSRDGTNQFELSLFDLAGTTEVSTLLLKADGNIAARFAAPVADEDLVTKEYGDANYLGGSGGGDFYADGHVPMTGDFQGGGNLLTGIADGIAADDAATVGQLSAGGGGDFMANGSIPMTGNMTFNAPPTIGTIFTQILREDGTLKLIYGSRDITDKFELSVYDSAGTSAVSTLFIKSDGNLAAPFAVPAVDEDLITKAYSDANYFQKSEFIDVSIGVDSAGKPILLNSVGQIDSSMLDVSVFYYVGEFTPAIGVEYPSTAGETYGAFWVVQSLGADYVFSEGDLAGRSVSNGDFMVWAAGGWSIMAGEMNPTLYYKLDGTQPLTDPFAAGGQQLKNLADGTELTDAVTKEQLDASGDFMSDGSVPMTGNLTFNSPVLGTMFTQILRPDGTIKIAYGSRNTTDQFELSLYNLAGTGEVSTLFIKADGNLSAPLAVPTADKDLITKTYGDTNYFFADGSVPMTDDFNGGGFKLQNIENGIAPADAVTREQLDASGDFKADGSVPMTGAFNGGGLRITNIIDGAATTDAATVAQVNASGDFYADGSVAMTDDFNGGGYKLQNIDNGIALTDAVTKEQLDASGDFMSDGTVPMTGTFNGGGLRITNIVDGTAPTDAATVAQLNASGDFMADGSVPMTDEFNGGGFKLQNIKDGTSLTDAATVAQVNASGDFYADGHVPMIGIFDGGAFKITNIADGSLLTDAVTLSQLNASGDFKADGSVPMTGAFN